jgi:hypothetical protein
MAIGSRGIGEEDDTDAEPDTGLNIDAGSLHPVAQEGVGNSQQETSAVARPVIRGHRPPMADTMERCEGGVDNTSTGSPSSVSDETDPAGVVLEARVVQARVTQNVLPTLAIHAASRHGRLNQKDGAASYPPHKRLSALS